MDLNVEQFEAASKVLGRDATSEVLSSALGDANQLLQGLRTFPGHQVGSSIADDIHELLNRLTAVGAIRLSRLLSQVETVVRNEANLQEQLLKEALEASEQCKNLLEKLGKHSPEIQER